MANETYQGTQYFFPSIYILYTLLITFFSFLLASSPTMSWISLYKSDNTLFILLNYYSSLTLTQIHTYI